jgi:YYY domain-containing protein
MLIVIVWWLWMQILGLAALPLTYRFFRRLPGRGYAFARPLGLLLTTYILWLGGSLGLLRNSVGGALVSLFVVAMVSLVYYWRGRARPAPDGSIVGDPGLLAWLRANLRLVLSVELLYAGALALWALLRAYSPQLTTAGGEKFMEIMYLNSIARSDYFPPIDAWLSGYAISYYYFGYVMTALVTMLSGFSAHLTFNVAVANLFALTCTGAFGLVYSLVKHYATAPAVVEPGHGRSRPILWGLLGAVLVAVMGNLEGFLETLYSARQLPVSFWQWLDIKEINLPFDQSLAPSLMPARSGWWWWRASRVIHDLDPAGNSMGVQPINEFPGFSFLLGDMHPHVLALPFVLLALAVALNALLKASEGEDTPEGAASWLAPVKRIPLLVPLCLGALAFLNTWDFPIYWLIFLVAFGLGCWRRSGQFDWPLIRKVGVTGVAVAILSFLIYLPFYIGFRSQAGGVMPTIYVGTRFRQYFVMFGPFLVALGGFLILLVARWRRKAAGRRWVKGWLGWTAALLLVPFALMLLISLALAITPPGRELLEGIRRIPAIYDIVGDKAWMPVLGDLLLVKLRYWVMPLVVAAMVALGVVLLQRSIRPASVDAEQGEGGLLRLPSVQFALICAVAGLLLTLSVEFFYLIDVFRVRANTIFKFYFQAWVLMGLASAFAIYYLTDGPGWRGRAAKTVRWAFLAAFWILFAMGMVYPVLGNIRRAEDFASAPQLDGTAYLADSQPDDYAAITWLKENVTGAPVILEAPGTGGSSYVYEGRVSALTGLPTLRGWSGHENQWRGSYEIQGAREPDIETIYNTLDPEEALTLVDKYDITYVYVGPVERGEYDPRGLAKFERFMEVAYRNDGVTIYKARR